MGTHNSMTYLKPKKWYMYPFRFIAKCQSLTIKEQFDRGVRLFDIRISYNKNNKREFKHGLISYKGDVYKTLEWLNSQNTPIQIRIILEDNKPFYIRDFLFAKDIHTFKEDFPNLSFYEGRRKCDWDKVVNLPELEVIQPVSSMCKNKLFSIWPWLYAKLFNKKNIKTYSDKTLLIDFIEIR